MLQPAGGALVLDLRRAEVDERGDQHDVGRVRGDELADRRILRHVALQLAQHPDEQRGGRARRSTATIRPSVTKMAGVRSRERTRSVSA